MLLFLLNPKRGALNLGYMENTAANQRRAALAFAKALVDNPHVNIVKVYVAPAPIINGSSSNTTGQNKKPISGQVE